MNNSRYIIGLKPFGNDSACCIIDTQDKTIQAYSTERLTRIKHDRASILPYIDDDILQNAVLISSIHYDREDAYYYFYLPKLYKKLGIHSLASLLPKVFALKAFKKTQFPLSLKQTVDTYFGEKMQYVPHHWAHIFGAYFFVPWKNKITLGITLDAEGDQISGMTVLFDSDKHILLHTTKAYEIKNDEGYTKLISLGALYSLCTKILGFIPQCDEGKTEALSAYGKSDTSFFGDLVQTIYVQDARIIYDNKMVKKVFDETFLTHIKNEIGDAHFASTIQKFLEYTVLLLLKESVEKHGCTHAVFSGGVFQNITLNYKIFQSGLFEEIFFSPFSGDEGTAVGSALYFLKENNYDMSWISHIHIPYWGQSYSRAQVYKILEENQKKYNIEFEDVILKQSEYIANDICENKIVALFQGNMEFGPRALGNRSILANAFCPDMKDILNQKIKKRSAFQPFCPAILETDRELLFEQSYFSPWMTSAFLLKKEYQSLLKSAIHIDGTARIGCVTDKNNILFHDILSHIKKRLGYGIMINTSFNIHGKTIVAHPIDALDDFLECEIDVLYIEGYKVWRKDRPIS